MNPNIERRAAGMEDSPKMEKDPTHMMASMGHRKPEDFQLQAKKVICSAINRDAHSSKDDRIFVEDLYVVWFCKTLQNWKCLISTDKIYEHYFEVTYDCDSHCTYLDTYTKAANLRVPD